MGDESRLNLSTSSSWPSADARSLEQEGPTTSGSGGASSSSRVIAGAAEVLSLLRIIGEGYRLSCLYRCKVPNEGLGFKNDT